MYSLSLLALAGAVAAQQTRGFNYGALYADQTARLQPDWEADFRAAQDLPGDNDFTSARLFTMVQGYSQTAEVIQALPAALATNTSLLLGIWCSGGEAAFQQELEALRTAIDTYGEELRSSIIGLSVGSEDLYRISPTGIENESGPGAEPQLLVDYIGRAREVLQGGPWADVPIGHVDTWTAYVNDSNSEVVAALDWVGVDAYPYFQTVNENSIDNAESLFFEAYDATVGAAQGKPVWITETGWPVTGPQSGQASSGTEPAETYWKDVACRIFAEGTTNVWWYQLNDGADQEVSFRVIPANRGNPLYDLSCDDVSTQDDDEEDTPSSTASRTGGSASATATGSVSTQGVGSPTDDQQNAGDQADDSPSDAEPTGTSSGSDSGYSQGGAGGSGSNATITGGAAPSQSSPAPYTGGAMTNAGSAGAALALVAGAIAYAM